MKKRIVSFALILVFFIFNFGQVYASSYNIALKENNIIEVESSHYGKDMRIMVEKGNNKYYYSLNNSKEELPVQLGDGSYLVKVLKNVEGNKYKVLKKSNVNIKNSSLDVFVSSSQPIYWEGNESLIDLAKDLIKDANTDKEKVEAIYQYIITNIKYDCNKINTISTDYVPDLDKVLIDKNGICYDYAALFAGLLRSQGIHTKLIKGYKNNMNEYHAWNEVLIDGNWVLIDTTYDAALSRGNRNLSMIKQFSEYNKIREY